MNISMIRAHHGDRDFSPGQPGDFDGQLKWADDGSRLNVAKPPSGLHPEAVGKLIKAPPSVATVFSKRHGPRLFRYSEQRVNENSSTPFRQLEPTP